MATTSKEVLVIMGNSGFYFVRDPHTGTYHVVEDGSSSGSLMIPKRTKYLCGAHIPVFPLDWVEPRKVLPRLTQGNEDSRGWGLPFGEALARDMYLHSCANCYRVLEARLKQVGSDLPGVLEELGGYYCRNLYLERVERKEEMATTNIVTLKVEVAFNMENVDLKDIMEAVDEIQQAATNYGKLEECSLTSLLPLKTDLHF